MVHGRDLWPVKADLSQFEQVIVNLAVNARDAMPDGGKLTIRTTNVTHVETFGAAYKGMPTGDYVLVEVADSGTGMPPEVMAQIFEPFFSTKEVGKGTGLGLSTVYGIVKQTGGFIYPESELGKRLGVPNLPAAPCRREGRDQAGRSTGDRGRLPPPIILPRPLSPILPAAAPCCWSKTRKACVRSMRAGFRRAAIRC